MDSAASTFHTNYLFYTLYMIPHNALLPEMVRNEGRLVDAYTWNSLFFVVGSMLGYATTAIVALIKKTGAEPIAAWRYTFLSFTVVGAIMIIPSLVVIGAATGESVGHRGLLLTAIVGGTFT